jgi:predicted RNA-binding Zn ribbon-like protein
MDYPSRALPLPLELLNTTFASGGQPRDALTSPADLDAWLDANAEHFPTRPSKATAADLARFRDLRAAARRIFSALVEATQPSTEDIELLNRSSAAAPRFARLDWQAAPRLTLATHATASASALGIVATATIELLAGPDRTRISRCQAPGCVLFFLREPRRRHWCSPGCGNRARVARHYARHVSPRTAPQRLARVRLPPESPRSKADD